jgi:hypothetical protein
MEEKVAWEDGITPIFGRGYFIPYFAGISFVYKFERNARRR